MSKRFSYTASFKLTVIKFAKEHGNRAAERHFGPPPTESVIRLWRQQEEKLLQMPRQKKAMRGKPPKWPEVEQEVKTWILEQRQTGISVSTKMIQEEGKRIAREKNIDDFSGTPKWCFNFMKREGLSLRTRTKLAPKLPAAYENQVLEFHSYVVSLRKTYNFELSQIASMDEVPLTFDVPSNRTVSVKGVNTMAVKTSGHEKTHFTVVLACCADGTKLPPMIILKRKTFLKEKIPSGVIVHMHEKGWMNEEGMKIWFNEVWSRRPGGLLKKTALLVFDHFKAHVTQSVKAIAADLKTQLAVVPGGLASQLQPLDVSVNKPFKALMKKEWMSWMQSVGNDLTPTGRIKKASITQVCDWILRSWNGVKKEVVVKSFKKCGISNAMDGTEDDEIYQDEESDSLEDTGNVKIKENNTSDIDSEEEFLAFYDT